MVVLGQSTRILEYLRNSQTRSKPLMCVLHLPRSVGEKSNNQVLDFKCIFLFSLFWGLSSLVSSIPHRSFAAAAAAHARYVVRRCVLLTSMCSRVDSSSDCAQFSNAENQSSAEIIAKKNVID